MSNSIYDIDTAPSSVNINGENYGKSAVPENKGEKTENKAHSEQCGATANSRSNQLGANTAYAANSDKCGSNAADTSTTEHIGENNALSAEVQIMSDESFDKYIDDILSGNKTHSTQEKVSEEETNSEIRNANVSDNETVSEEETNQTRTGEEVPDEQTAEPFKTFSSQEEYQVEIDRIFSKRFKDYKQTKADHAELLDRLCDVYGVDTYYEAACALRQNSDALRAENRYQTPQSDYEAERAQIFFQLQSLKEIDPDFSPIDTFRNDTRFKTLLEQTNSPYLAYADYVKRTSNSNPSNNTDKVPERSQIKKRTFTEDTAANPSSVGRVQTDASRLSDEDFEKYIQKIQNEF